MHQKLNPCDEVWYTYISGVLALFTAVLSRGWLLITGVCQPTCKYSRQLYLPGNVLWGIIIARQVVFKKVDGSYSPKDEPL